MTCTTPMHPNMKYGYAPQDFVLGGTVPHGNGQIYSTENPTLCVESIGRTTLGARLMLKKCRPIAAPRAYPRSILCSIPAARWMQARLEESAVPCKNAGGGESLSTCMHRG